MILAAGEGRRLRPLTETIPKPMIRMHGKPILEYHLDLLRRHGVDEVAINLHHQPEVITSYFGNGERWGVRIIYSYEEELLGTAGAVRRLKDYFYREWSMEHGEKKMKDSLFSLPHSPILVLYGDNLTTCDLTRFATFHQTKGGVATIALHVRDNPTNSGIVGLDDDDRVSRFLEKPSPEQVFSHWVNAGILVLEPEVLDMIPDQRPSDFGRDIFPALLNNGKRIYGYRMSGREALWWIDTPEDLHRVQAIWEQREPL